VVTDSISLQLPLDATFFLLHEFQIDRLLDVSAWTSPALADDVRAAVQLMVPQGCTRDLIRVGGDGDGAYLLPDDLLAIDACFSPGVSTLVEFENQLARDYRIPAYLCDGSVERSKLDLDPELHVFSRKWLGSFDGSDTQSLDAWVLASDHAEATNLLLQMDIEGSEYGALLAASDSILGRFRILVVEFHLLPALQSSRFLNSRFLPVLHKLLRQFDCVHAHANNCLPAIDLYGYAVPQVIELSFYRKRENQGIRKPWRPHPLDVLNVADNPPLALGKPWL